ncbi:peroxiredoxin [Paraflavitalea speifideaquila]|uniref:peroxiredoxin n=1 Tax=Paraflavitalea speifideaquila TaxID=3076558 RepID=UPI0028EF6640|nr:peroxiredoxin [Paraflavitalea speifideiaquila]
MLTTNDLAPDFELPSTPNRRIALHDLRGKNVILAFYPADWSPVCGDQMALYNEMLSFFEKYNASLLGISVDSKWSHEAYMEQRKLHFPLLADFEPKGAVAQKYGVYDAEEGQCERALFVIDDKGIIRWSYLSPMLDNPGADGIIEALETITQSTNTSHGVKTPTSA